MQCQGTCSNPLLPASPQEGTSPLSLSTSLDRSPLGHRVPADRCCDALCLQEMPHAASTAWKWLWEKPCRGNSVLIPCLEQEILSGSEGDAPMWALLKAAAGEQRELRKQHRGNAPSCTALRLEKEERSLQSSSEAVCPAEALQNATAPWLAGETP